MNCRYCGSTNAPSDHRCLRCGRRLHLAAARPAPDLYPLIGASALAAERKPTHQAAPSAVTEPVPEPIRRAPYQPALFATQDLGRIVPIEAYKQRAAERSQRAQHAESIVARQTGPAPLQPHLPFGPSSTQSGAVAARGSAADGGLSDLRFSDAPVAIPVHRLMAAAIDFGMVLVAAGVLCLVIAFGANNGFLPGSPQHWFAGLGLALSGIYKLFWAAINTDSPGLRWCQLRLLHFDGRDPVRHERLARIAWALMSVMAGGLGLIWALVDEESLSWHDHSSKTFLTPFSQDKKKPR